MTRSFYYFSTILLITILAFSSCRNTEEKNNDERITSDTTMTSELERLNGVVKANPEKAEPYLERAKYFAHNQMYNEALADINSALDINGDDPEVYQALAEVYLYSGKTQRALDALKKAQNMAPADSDIDVGIAKVYLTMSDYKQTFNSLREALRKNPDNAEAFFLSGLANEEMGDTIKAIDSYQSAVAKNNKYYDALKQLGILFSIRHDALAVDYLRNAASLRPDQPDPLYILGMHYQENGEPDKALSVYQEILQVDSTFKLAHYNSGYVYLVYKNEFDNAIDQFNKAIQLDPEYTEAYYNRGYAHELMGDFESARKDYQQVLRMRINDDKAVNGLNRIDAMAGAE